MHIIGFQSQPFITMKDLGFVEKWLNHQAYREKGVVPKDKPSIKSYLLVEEWDVVAFKMANIDSNLYVFCRQGVVVNKPNLNFS